MNAHTSTPSGTTVLVVAGGKGGTGVSLVAALLALAVAGEGWRVLLVDGTGRLGALHQMLGAEPRQVAAALHAGGGAMDALLLPVTDTLSLFPGGGAELPAVAPDAEPLAAADRQLLLERAAACHDRFDLVVVDAGARLDGALAACGAGATRLLLATTEDRIAMAATHALLKAVDAHVPALPADVVVNRAAEHAALAVHDHLATAAERFLGRPVGFAGAIPDDPCLEGGLRAGMTVQDAAAGSPAALAARAAGLQLLADGTNDRNQAPHDRGDLGQAPRDRGAMEPAPHDGGALRSLARNA